MNKFIGHKKIKKVGAGGKTYLGNPRVKIDFEDGTTLYLPKEVYTDVATDEMEQDLAILQEKRIRPLVQKIIMLLTEAELNRDDIQQLIQVLLPDTIFQANKLANENLWGKKDYEVTLFDIDRILSYKKNENKK